MRSEGTGNVHWLNGENKNVQNVVGKITLKKVNFEKKIKICQTTTKTNA
jgi:hypothetical protein